jgi:hypothetical protein
MDGYDVVSATVVFISAGEYEIPMQERFEISFHQRPELWESLLLERYAKNGWIPRGGIEIVTVSYTYAKKGEAKHRR